jgi:hypothetical protein
MKQSCDISSLVTKSPVTKDLSVTHRYQWRYRTSPVDEQSCDISSLVPKSLWQKIFLLHSDTSDVTCLGYFFWTVSPSSCRITYSVCFVTRQKRTSRNLGWKDNKSSSQMTPKTGSREVWLIVRDKKVAPSDHYSYPRVVPLPAYEDDMLSFFWRSFNILCGEVGFDV